MSKQFAELFKDLEAAIVKAQAINQANKTSPQANHLTMMADGLGALGWLSMERSPKPADYAAELFGGAQMYGNRVLKEAKDK
jgi:adenylyl cyclase-associated protein